MADIGIGGLYAGGIGEGNEPGYDDPELGGEAVGDSSQERSGIGGKDEGVIGNSFVNCNIASVTPNCTTNG